MKRIWITAIFSLGIMNAQSAQQAAWETLDHGLQSDSTEHRMQAVVALSTVVGDNAEAVKRVTEALQHDKNAQVRRTAAAALGTMKAKSAIPALQAALADNNEIAFAAAKSLSDMGDPSGRDVLVAVLAGERKDTPGFMTKAVRSAKAKLRDPQALILMGVSNATGAFFPPADMGLMAVTEAAHVQGKSAPGRAAAAASLVKDPDPYAVTLLEWALNDDSHMVRIEAAKGLGERGNAQSIAKLEPLLKDDHTSVRAIAAASIIRLDNK